MRVAALDGLELPLLSADAEGEGLAEGDGDLDAKTEIEANVLTLGAREGVVVGEGIGWSLT